MSGAWAPGAGEPLSKRLAPLLCGVPSAALGREALAEPSTSRGDTLPPRGRDRHTYGGAALQGECAGALPTKRGDPCSSAHSEDDCSNLEKGIGFEALLISETVG